MDYRAGQNAQCAAAIVTYNPNVELLSRVLEAVYPQASIMLLVDNGSENADSIDGVASRYEGAEVLHLGENKGIAVALNTAFEEAKLKEISYVLTLDQDTVVDEAMVAKLARHLDDRVAIVCPQVLYVDNEEYQQVPKVSVERIEWAITSGSLTSLKAWNDIGGFDEQMFIDGVDKDFCLRLRKAEWAIVRSNDVVIHHRLGKLRCRRILGRTIYVTSHPSWRYYYMARNSIYLCRKGLVGTCSTFCGLGKLLIKVALLERGGGSSKQLLSQGASEEGSTWIFRNSCLEVPNKCLDDGNACPQVAILLSTYNGEQWLEELLDSVLGQKGVDTHLFVRDDGSCDGTIEILRHRAKKTGKITVFEGENIGVIASFNDLMSRPQLVSFKYIAFCDQDDVWLPDKLLKAVSMLDKCDCKKPALYCSNLTIVDRELKPQHNMRSEGIAVTLEGLLVQNFGTGCTQVFNQAARTYYLLGLGCDMEMHDYWMSLICMCIGNVVYDNESQILYRQHEDNVVGAKKKNPLRVLARIMTKSSSKRLKMVKCFIECYRECLPDSVLKTLKLFYATDNSPYARVKVTCSNKYIGQTRAVTLAFRIRCLVGHIY